MEEKKLLLYVIYEYNSGTGRHTVEFNGKKEITMEIIYKIEESIKAANNFQKVFITDWKWIHK